MSERQIKTSNKNSRGRRGLRVVAGVLACLMLCMQLPVQPVQAADATGTTTLRILSTTDLHGQSVNVNYDSASVHNTGSLAQAATIIKQAKQSLKYGNTLLVDCGDTIYGYGSDVINNGSVDGPEYMYAEMATMGYDAMTVGNHDFDYGYMYLKEQLEESGLNSKVVVSNVYDAKSKKNIWAENKVITKKLKTTTGKTMSVKIGLIGVTVPTLTTHYDHSLLLTTKDMVESVEEQVAKLKKQNTDLIIVMGHTGIGSEEYVQMSENAAYAISKVKGVDAIVGGHAHVNFPSGDANVQKFYDYPGISAEGLLNGVPYSAVKDHGAGVGMIDLKLKMVNGKVTVAGSNVKVKLVKASTKADASIVELNDSYQEQLDDLYSTELAKIDGKSTTYFGPLEDNVVIQLANEAKIHYGLEYINQEKPQFKDCPVIAATSYGLVGKGKPDDVKLNGSFTIEDSLKIQNRNKEFAFIYSMTGDQIREWLEWQASAYQNPNDVKSATWKDEIVELYAKKESMIPLLNPEWMDDWSGFMVFDGIEYEIDPTKDARYNKDGTLINKKAHRITSLTCNGKEVTDDMEFALVSPRLNSASCKVATSISEYVICNKRVYINDLLQDYLKDQNGYAPLSAKPDNNWNVLFPEESNYLVKFAKSSESTAKSESWYEKTLEKSSKYGYYQVSLGEEAATAGSAPLLVVGLGKTKRTNHGVPIVAQASDRSGIRALKYAKGSLTTTSDAWNNAASITGKTFEVYENGAYTVMAEDIDGNRTVKYINVTNYDSQALEAPEITKCTNRAKQILGTAEVKTSVYAKTGGVTYTAEVAEDGTFAIDTPKLPADAQVRVWIVDAKGNKSEETICTVKRTGANLPQVDALTNKTHEITGVLNDSKYCKVVAVVGDTVYVPENGGIQSYENCSVYDYEKKIETVPYEVSDGTFSLHIPVPLAGAKYQVYSLDWTDKNSVVTNLVAEEVAPNQPTLSQLYTVDDYVYGKIPAAKNGTYEVNVSDGTNVYTGAADANGRFAVEVGDLTEGTQLTVTASDTVDGKTRTSAQAKMTVASCETINTAYSEISFDAIDSKMTTVSGHMKDYEGKINLMIGDVRVTTSVASDGAFSYDLPEALAVGTPITALVRDTDGSIWDANRTDVSLALPEMPELLTETIYDTTAKIKLFCEDEATAVVKIGKKYYKAFNGVYSEKRGGYVYTVAVTKPPKAGEQVIVYMMNDTGKSGKHRTIVEADPTVQEKEEKPAEQTAEKTE